MIQPADINGGFLEEQNEIPSDSLAIQIGDIHSVNSFCQQLIQQKNSARLFRDSD